jgi:hypothetical protein
MCGLEIAKNIEEEKSLDNMSDAELNAEEALLQIRRGELQEEIEDAVERLKRISEIKLERNIPNK